MTGDREAFAALAVRISDDLFAVGKRILRDADLADDAVQQTLLQVWRQLPQLRDPDRFQAWAYRLLVNACHAEARHERRHRDNLRLLPDDEPSMPDGGSHLAAQDQIDRAFRTLSVEHRTAVVLVHYLDMTSAQAASVMGTPVGTVRSRLHYALDSMRATIEADSRTTAKRGTA